MAKIAKQKNARFIVDTCGEALTEAVKEGVYLIKPNLNELAWLAEKKTVQPEEVKHIAADIIAKGGCEVMVVSMGAKGALLVTEEMSVLIQPPPVIKKSTVGAGDSMVAGIVFYLSQGMSILEAAQYGVCCGTAATLHAGTELCNKDDADRFYSAIHPDQIYNM